LRNFEHYYEKRYKPAGRLSYALNKRKSLRRGYPHGGFLYRHFSKQALHNPLPTRSKLNFASGYFNGIMNAVSPGKLSKNTLQFNFQKQGFEKWLQ